jgi:AAA domain
MADDVDTIITQAHNDLTLDPDAQQRLRELTGIGEQAIYRLKLGWTDDERVTLPVADAAGRYVGVQFYQPDPAKRDEAHPKMKGQAGSKRDLFPPPETYPPGADLVLCEGEPDACVAITLGFNAVAIPGTSGWRSEYAERFAAFGELAIFTDSDPVGRKLAADVAHDLEAHPHVVRLVDLAPDDDDGYDLKDDVLLARRNGQSEAQIAEALRSIIRQAAAAQNGAGPVDEALRPWHPKGIHEMSTEPPPGPEIADLFYRSAINMLQAEPTSGKSILAAWAALWELDAGGRVFWIDHEQGEATVLRRMLQMGVVVDEVRDRFMYLRDPAAFPDRVQVDLHAAWLRRVLAEYRPTLVIVDAVSGSLAAHSYSENSNDDIARWEARVARPLADDAGAAVLLLDHVTKDPDSRGLWAIGAQRKRSMVTGAAYTLIVDEPFAVGQPGAAHLKTTKDRHGYRALSTNAARFQINGSNHEIRIDADTTTEAAADADSGPAWYPTEAMDKASALLQRHGTLTPQEAKDLIGKMRLQTVRQALEALAVSGYATAKKHGRATHYSYVKLYREGDSLDGEPAATELPDWLGDDFT